MVKLCELSDLDSSENDESERDVEVSVPDGQQQIERNFLPHTQGAEAQMTVSNPCPKAVSGAT